LLFGKPLQGFVSPPAPVPPVKTGGYLQDTPLVCSPANPF